MKTVERHKKTDFGDVWYVNAIDGTYRFAVYKYDDDQETIYLSNVFVKEESRRQGYGNEILTSAEEYANRLGASVICLKVLSGSDVHRWYRRHGYEDLEKDEEERGYMWMKKDLKKVNESVWADMHKRSDGQAIRKEDDIPFGMGDALLTYIWMFSDKLHDTDDYELTLGDFISFIRDFSDDERVKSFNPDIPGLITYVKAHWDDSVSQSIQDTVNDIDMGLDNIAGVDESVWVDMHKRSTGEQVRKEDEITQTDMDALVDSMNEFATRVVWDNEKFSREKFCECVRNYLKFSKEVNIENIIKYIDSHWTGDIEKDIEGFIEEEEKEKNNGMNESIWSDIHKRSNGEQVRKEDMMTQKDLDDLSKLINFYANEVVYGRGMNTDACNLDDFCDYIERSNDIKDLNMDKILQYVKDNWADEICDDVDASIEQASLEYHQDMNESVWADIHKRSNGEQVRKEDEMNTDDFLMLRETAKMFQIGVRNYANNKFKYAPRRIDGCDGFIDYILERKKEHFWNDTPDEVYDKVIKFVKDNWGDCTGIQEFMDKYLSNINECDGAPGGLTPADVGGMGEITFPGADGTPGSGDIPMPTGHVYQQVAPFGIFIRAKKGKKRKKKFRKEDEPCVHSENPPIYSHVDDFRDYVDRVYNQIDRKK